ncbi:MAG: sensor domain-containing diguanylate cyclase [Massilia sp.]|nr:sensor domain-containing diguanylate cyclase [Massilia sp.]
MPLQAERREAQRLQALHQYNILDTPAEDFFDDIVLLAALACNTPIALITLVDSTRQWFKAKIGIQAIQTAREISVCQYALAHPDNVLVISDVTQDARFTDNPLVRDTPHMRFYAGAPLVTAERQVLGTLCVIDSRARTLSRTKQKVLQVLARRVVAALDTRSEIASLQILSTTDALTGLHNRRAFNAIFTAKFSGAKCAGEPLSLILCDIDHFKQFNDTLGHPAGDRLLQFVSAALRRCARGTDDVTRLGGDEFAIILPNTSCDVAWQIAHRLRQAMLAQFEGEPAVTLSIGVADLQPGMENETTLFSEADHALYEAKRQGRDSVATEC